MPSIPSQDTPVTTGAYDASSAVSKVRPKTRRNYRKLFAWVSATGGSDKSGSYKFPHHVVGSDGTPGAANVGAVKSAMSSVDGSSIPAADKTGVKSHLQRHLDKAGVKPDAKPPEAKSYDLDARIEEDWRL